MGILYWAYAYHRPRRGVGWAGRGGRGGVGWGVVGQGRAGLEAEAWPIGCVMGCADLAHYSCGIFVQHLDLLQ